MNCKHFLSTCILASAMSAPVAFAAETDTFVVSGTYGQTGYVYTSGYGAASATVSITDSGVNQTATLMHWSNDSANGYQYWRGNIPVEAVTSTGINGISVSINTCMVDNRYGCGQVDLAVTADVPANGWIDNGATQHTGAGYMYQQTGSRIVRFSSSTGSVNGIPLDSSRAFMSKGNDVTITVTTGE